MTATTAATAASPVGLAPPGPDGPDAPTRAHTAGTDLPRGRRDPAAARWEARVALPATPHAPRLARRAVRALLAGSGAGGDDVHAALVVVSELTANALVHTGAREPVGLVLTLRGSALTVAVDDPSPALPRPRPLTDSAEGGRGLALVAALAEAWGSEPLPDGKRVWATIRFAAALGAAARAA